MFILLADDERMVRLSLEAMLEELYPYQHIFVHARNGREMITQIKRQPPDIAFVDIKMPLLTGLEALEKCRDISPATTWIILSGFADFSFAQKAIGLSAYAYILKPISLDTLRELCEKICLEKRKNVVQEHGIFCHDIVRSFNMADQFGGGEVDFQPHGNSEYTIYQIYIDRLLKQEQHQIKQFLYTQLDQYCAESPFVTNYCLFFSNAGQLCLVCSSTQLTQLTQYIGRQIQTLPACSVAVFFGSGRTVKELYSISEQISALSSIKLIKNNRQPIELSIINQNPLLKQQLFFCDRVELLCAAYLDRNIGSFKQLLCTFSQNSNMKAVFPCIDRKPLFQYLFNIYHQRFFASNFDEFISELDHCADILPSGACKDHLDISKIQDYLYQNYMKDISLSYVSEHFNISPTYLSKIFHEKTGVKYIDFVTSVKMENAKKMLLGSSSVSVKTVSEQTGYTSVRHFSRTFQKYTGILPSCYFDAFGCDGEDCYPMAAEK